MPHSLYRTEGLILGSKNLGEANRLIYLLTPAFGLLLALAQGVRFLHSKLRYHLQDFIFGEFTLVRGRDYWRITGAKQDVLTTSLLSEPVKRAFLFRVCRLLRRLVRGEGSQQLLFADLRTAFLFLAENNLPPESLIKLELLLVLRLLYHLGHLECRDALAPFLGAGVFARREVLDYSPAVKRAMLEAVNQALRHSQL